MTMPDLHLTIEAPFAAARPLLDKLVWMAALESGWAYGEGIAFGAAVLEAARSFVMMTVHDGTTADLFPNFDGSIAVTFYSKGHVIEWTIAPGEQGNVLYSYTRYSDDEY
jgi:hypothetical protein